MAGTGMSHDEMKQFVRDHFEEFVNRKNVDIGEVNFADEFVDHGADVPPQHAPRPERCMAYVGGALKRFPDLPVNIDDLIAEGDRVVVRNTWTATDSQNNRRIRFRGIVIWRIEHRQLVERWAFLEPPQQVE